MVVQAGEEILVSADCAQPGGDIHITVGTGGGGDSGPVSWDELLDKPTTVSGFGLTDAVTTSDSRLTDAREWTASTITQAEAEAGTATTRRAWTAERVRQAIVAWWTALSVPIAKVTGLQAALDAKAPIDSPQFTNFADAARFTDDIDTVTSVSGGFITTRQISFSLNGTVQTTAFTGALKTKLDGIAAGATVNATDAALRDRSTHTGTQAANTITGLAAIATSGSASDLSAGTVPSARFPNTVTIPGSGSSGFIELVGNNTLTARRPTLRIRNAAATTATNYVDFGIGSNGVLPDDFICAMNDTTVFAIQAAASYRMAIYTAIGVFNNSQIVNINNANAYLNLNDGSGGMQLSSVTSMQFQRSYTEIGRWDGNSAWNVGTSHATVSGCTGASVTGTQARARFPNQVSTSAGQFAAAGDAQASRYHLRNSTTNATPATLFRDGSSARLTIPAQSCWSFKIRLSAYNSTDGIGAAWTINGGIRRDNANNTALLGTPTVTQYADTSMASAAVSVTADDTNEALQIQVTGIAAKTIRWHAVVETSEVSAGTPS